MPRLVGPTAPHRGEGRGSSHSRRDASGNKTIKEKNKEKRERARDSSNSNNLSSKTSRENLSSRNNSSEKLSSKTSRENLVKKDSKNSSTTANASFSAKQSSSSSTAPNDASWTPPLWLTKVKPPHRTRNLTIPIPPVPADTRKAIQKYIEKQQPPYHKQQAQMQLLQNKLKGQKEKAKLAQKKLDKLEESKAERIQEIKVMSQEELEAKFQTIQEELEKEHAAAAKAHEEEWKQNTEKEAKAAKRQYKKEQAELAEKDREAHQQKVQEELELQAKQAKAKDDDDDKDLLPSQKLEREHAKVKEKLDGLKETKKEIVWLLKQVINAEKKRKAPEPHMPPKKKQIKL
ncbi:expressed unknown protein [Seminavis robusta]|uniref:Uncharacterized protein n=1 Tax=Seminavis robusta TaxID=568900 RepID=A0A9N8EBQ5_9STRA|nr:expressed unknown protein [Seminavis robusta]|eukprot:Sro859_g211930.1 n/a (346) ;mRNA; r:10351-11388